MALIEQVIVNEYFGNSYKIVPIIPIIMNYDVQNVYKMHIHYLR